MRIIRLVIVLVAIAGIWSGCSRGSKDIENDITTSEGLINAELFLQNDTVISFWKIREIPGRGTLSVQEGIMGGEVRGYEVYEEDRSALIKRAVDFTKEKIKEGYSIFGPESYSQMIIQVDTLYWGDVSDVNRLAFVEDLLSDALMQSGNGRCTGSDISHKVSFFAVVFDVDIATGTILKALRDNNIDFPVVIAVEKGNDITIVYPENYQGEFSLI